MLTFLVKYSFLDRNLPTHHYNFWASSMRTGYWNLSVIPVIWSIKVLFFKRFLYIVKGLKAARARFQSVSNVIARSKNRFCQNGKIAQQFVQNWHDKDWTMESIYLCWPRAYYAEAVLQIDLLLLLRKFNNSALEAMFQLILIL